jgi:RNA polymerase sigma-70 factor (ECF subfamily)
MWIRSSSLASHGPALGLVRAGCRGSGSSGVPSAAGVDEAAPMATTDCREELRKETPSAAESLAPLAPGHFREHMHVLWRVVSRLGVPAHSVDDVIQETFITASRRGADIAAGQLRSFLLATAIRLSANYRRRAHVRREVGQGDGFETRASTQPNAEQLLETKRLRELLERALGELSGAQRAVFVLFEFEGFSMLEITSILGLPLGTVSSRLMRARAKFSTVAARLQGRAKLERP